MGIAYDRYLEEHKYNVRIGYEWLREYLPEVIAADVKYNGTIDYEHQIGFAHDESKSNPDEYAAYDAYFYGGNRSYRVVNDFRYAWLRHIHRNPHHWQYWVLINDDPEEGEIIMDIPINYIVEMICDWWAFSWKNNNLYEIFGWYDEHKTYMKLSDKTRIKVELILNRIKTVLNGGSDGTAQDKS